MCVLYVCDGDNVCFLRPVEGEDRGEQEQSVLSEEVEGEDRGEQEQSVLSEEDSNPVDVLKENMSGELCTRGRPKSVLLKDH